MVADEQKDVDENARNQYEPDALPREDPEFPWERAGLFLGAPDESGGDGCISEGRDEFIRCASRIEPVAEVGDEFRADLGLLDAPEARRSDGAEDDVAERGRERGLFARAVDVESACEASPERIAKGAWSASNAACRTVGVELSPWGWSSLVRS
ncbi:MAG: hypothetical protein KIT19_10680 [Phycisphaeraceae bacterium]|nr:hypothetical protein [Phycisphaeraceae bacterium]